ncbi:MAG: hypothetical protein HP492_18745 [Nitrospira sp.]|nr:hypothetical protein [Nitrospira sp.]
MVWLKIFIQIVSVAAAYLVARLDYVTHDKRTRSFKLGRFWLWVLLIVLVVGNIFVIWNDDQEGNKIKTQLGDLRNELGNTKKAVTGGDNFPYVMINMGKDSGGLLVHNPGDTPLYDVSFRMWDPADYEAPNKPSRSFEEFLAKSIIREVGNLTPSGASYQGTIPLPNSDSKDFKVTIRARNGGFTEWIKLRKVNGVWTRAVRVHPGEVNPGESILYEFADPGFPSAELGNNRK